MRLRRPSVSTAGIVLGFTAAVWAVSPDGAVPTDASQDHGLDGSVVPSGPTDAATDASDAPTASDVWPSSPGMLTTLDGAVGPTATVDATIPATGAGAVPTVAAEPALAPPDDGTDVVQYTLTARLDPTRHQVAAEGTLRWRNTSRVTVHDLWLHLYLNGFAHDETLFMRTTGGEHRGNEHGRYGHLDLQRLETAAHEDLLRGAAADPAVPNDTSQLHVPLPHALAPGESVDLSMAWTAVLPEVFARTGYHDRFHMVAQWFPKVAVLESDGHWAHFPFHGNSEFYADFGRYDVTMTVPRRWVVGATGQPTGPVEHTPEGDRWRYTAARVHDFAWTTWDAFHERSAMAGDVSVRVLYPPGEEPSAARVLASLQAAMPFDARRFGSYPYPNLTVMIPPEGADGAGGMEYPTFITTEGAWWIPQGARITEYVTLHEYAHQYFYGLLASNENAWPFLDEGLAEYATCLSMEGVYGPEGSGVSLAGARLECFANESAGSASIGFPEAVALAAPAYATFGDYARHVYSRTATVLRTAEGIYGSDRVRDAMALYTQRARFHHPVPEDLFQAFRDSRTDDAVDRLLIPALTQPASLDYAVDTVESHAVGGGRFQGRAVIRRRGTLELPVDIMLEGADGGRRVVRWDGHGTATEIPYAGHCALRSVRVDPYNRVPLDEDRTNDARTADTTEASSMGLVARAAYWVELALGSLGP